MNIVLTGSEGFIGSVLKQKLLKDNHKVICWDIKINKNIKDFTLNGDEDFVIHLAAIGNVRESVKNPEPYFETNVVYSNTVFKKCAENNIPCLYASSSCAYFPEKSPYGRSKKIMERIAYDGQVGLRFTTVYGDNPRKGMLFDRILNNQVEYKTNHIRDFIHVNDVVEAIMIFVNTGLYDKKQVYDVCTGKGINIKKLVEDLGFDVPLKEGEKCEAESNARDNSDLKSLGWSPKIDVYNFLKDKKII